jgi:hypothetical protein
MFCIICDDLQLPESRQSVAPGHSGEQRGGSVGMRVGSEGSGVNTSSLSPEARGQQDLERGGGLERPATNDRRAHDGGQRSGFFSEEHRLGSADDIYGALVDGFGHIDDQPRLRRPQRE